jgi:hypothetical protein
MRGALVLGILVALATAARAEPALRWRPALSAEFIYNDAVELIFGEEQNVNQDSADNPGGSMSSNGFAGTIGLGASFDAAVAVDAHPFSWLSLELRPQVFTQIFFDNTDTLVVRLSPPLFVQARLHPQLTLVAASEYVGNFVPNRSRFTFHRETASNRLQWTPRPWLTLDLDWVERIKRYPQQPSWDFSAHRFGVGGAAELGAHARVSLSYAVQLNSGARSLATPGASGATADGTQHIAGAALRLGFGVHLVEASYQVRVARGGDSAVAVDQPLLSPSGMLEEDTDELSLGGFDKHIVELTYDVRLGTRVSGDLYGRYSRKSYRRLASSMDPTRLRVDDLWLMGATLSVRLLRGFNLDGRVLYRINDSDDPAFTFRNLIVGVAVRWEK